MSRLTSRFPPPNWAIFILLFFALCFPNYRLLALFDHFLALHPLQHLQNSPPSSRLSPTARIIPTSRFEIPVFDKDNEDPQVPSQPFLPQNVRNRVLLSALPDQNSDVVGLAFAMLNFELNAAFAMNVAYIHRMSTHLSLTRTDPSYLHAFFGWDDYPLQRDNFLQQHCHVRTRPINCTHRARPASTISVCEALKPNSPFKEIVNIPFQVADCINDKRTSRKQCHAAWVSLAAKHDKPNTIFQLLPSTCPSRYHDVMFRTSARTLRTRYWQRHFTRTTLTSSFEDVHRLPGRVLPFLQHRVQVVVHIRRGDLLYQRRHIIPDWAFVAIIADVKKAMDAAFDKAYGMDVTIVSEGRPKDGGRLLANHDIDRMSDVYQSETMHNISNASSYFKTLILNELGQKPSVTHDIRVRSLIATDIVKAMHLMVCADVFVGSDSWLSTFVAGTLARGLVILPVSKYSYSAPKQLQIRFDDSARGLITNLADVKLGLSTVFPSLMLGGT